jgi:hypothetical protein
MSMDYVIVCDPCKSFVACGYYSAGKFRFLDANASEVGEFIVKHTDHHPLYQQGGDERGGLRVVDQQCDSYGGYKNESED